MFLAFPPPHPSATHSPCFYDDPSDQPHPTVPLPATSRTIPTPPRRTRQHTSLLVTLTTPLDHHPRNLTPTSHSPHSLAIHNSNPPATSIPVTPALKRQITGVPSHTLNPTTTPNAKSGKCCEGHSTHRRHPLKGLAGSFVAPGPKSNLAGGGHPPAGQVKASRGGAAGAPGETGLNPRNQHSKRFIALLLLSLGSLCSPHNRKVALSRLDLGLRVFQFPG